MSSQTKTKPTKKIVFKTPIKKTKSQEMQKSRIQKDLDKLRKSKEFRELGDMLYL